VAEFQPATNKKEMKMPFNSLRKRIKNEGKRRRKKVKKICFCNTSLACGKSKEKKTTIKTTSGFHVQMTTPTKGLMGFNLQLLQGKGKCTEVSLTQLQIA
jgi:hypothetical protein